MTGWQRDRERLRLALTRLIVVTYYRPISRLWQAVVRALRR